MSDTDGQARSSGQSRACSRLAALVRAVGLAGSIALLSTWALATAAADARSSTAPMRPSGASHPTARDRHHRGAEHPSAHTAVVGGSSVSIDTAPWQVTVEATFKNSSGTNEGILCGGSLIDESHVLTAAHCTFIAAPDERIPASDFVVIAGSSDLAKSEAEAQAVHVSGVRVHPYYTYTPDSGHVNADDVAVLELSQPLTLGPAVAPIALAAPGAYPAEGMALQFTGFGEQSWQTKADGQLYGLSLNVGQSEQCGGEKGENSAVLLCASAPGGSPCSGDSGSGLTTPGPTPMLIGVMNDDSVIDGRGCVDGASSSFANIAAPEIQDFIDGVETPPRAPRGGGASCSLSTPTVGSVVSCSPGTWSNDPNFTYSFIDSATGAVLQTGGSAEYKLAALTAGSTVFMRLTASNAGGQRVVQTPPTPTISPASLAPASAAPSGNIGIKDHTIEVHAPATASVKLSCEATVTCKGRIAISVSVRRRVHGEIRHERKTIATATFTIAAGASTQVKLNLDHFGSALLASDHGHLSATLSIERSTANPTQTSSDSVRLITRRASPAKPKTKQRRALASR